MAASLETILSVIGITLSSGIPAFIMRPNLRITWKAEPGFVSSYPHLDWGEKRYIREIRVKVWNAARLLHAQDCSAHVERIILNGKEVFSGCVALHWDADGIGAKTIYGGSEKGAWLTLCRAEEKREFLNLNTQDFNGKKLSGRGRYEIEIAVRSPHWIVSHAMARIEIRYIPFVGHPVVTRFCERRWWGWHQVFRDGRLA